MQMNDAGYALLKSFEQCRLMAYRDQGGVWTIGWGHTGPEVEQGLTWTQQQADTALVDDVNRTVDELLDMIEPELSDNQFSACVCLAYNIGTHAFYGSSALPLINGGLLDDVPRAIELWNKVRINGALHISRGLVRRRAAEIALWSKP
jgi:lysozyme